MSGPAPLFPPGLHAAHAVLEVNQQCNISCRACYKQKSGYTKPYRRITAEVDALLARRKLSTITIAGGEPTLHPDLPRIIRYCADQGLIVAVISNGFDLPNDLLERCRKAGLSDFILHLDSLQTRADAPRGATEPGLFPLREALVRRVSDHGIACSLALTLYRSTLCELPAVVEWVIAQPRVQRLVLFCCGAIGANLQRFAGGTVLGTTYPAAAAGGPERVAAEATPLAHEQVGCPDVETVLSRLGMQAFSYVASNRSTDERRWIVYHSLALHGAPGLLQVLHLRQPTARLIGLLRRLAVLVRKPAHFGGHLSETQCLGLALLHALSCGRLRESARALAFCAGRLRPGARISSKPITVQQPPSVSGDGQLVYCRECPDATIRNGTLVPVCMADYLVGPNRDAPSA